MSLFTDLKEVLTPYAQRIKGLAAADEEIKADLGAQTGVISLIKDYYIKTSDTPIDLTPIPSSVGRMYAVVDCTAGDKFVINAYSESTASATWCFIDSANNAISMADANTAATGLELTAPENAVKLIINDKSGGMSYKVGNNLISRVSEIERGGSGLSDDAKQALLECFKHIGWANDANGQDYYNTLEDALYPDAIYDIWHWDSRESGKNKLYRIPASNMPYSINGVSVGVDFLDGQIPANNRRGFCINNGLQAMVNHNAGTLTTYFPIPVPKNAHKMTAKIYPETEQLCGYLFKYLGYRGFGSYEYTGVSVGPRVYATAVDTFEFTPDVNLFVAFTIRRDASNTAFTNATEPELEIIFE